MMILIFCAHSGQNNVQESARTAWSGIYWCIGHDEFPSRREVKNILIEVIPLVRQRAFPRSRRDHAGTATSGVKAAQRPKGLALTPAQGGGAR
jgi:hypothetical protein